MKEVFGPVYSEAYDVLYHDKDYVSECSLIEQIFEHYADGEILKILDLGCGTGNHSIPLAERGYLVTGIDRSEGMIAQCRQKVLGGTVKGAVAFHRAEICGIDLDEQFDAALMMFAVLGYQLGNDDVLAALRTARRHLRRGGLFVFDVWYGPAVLSERPTERVKSIPVEGGEMVRRASASLDVRQHLCTVHFHLRKSTGRLPVVETHESHQMRFFFPLELELFLESSGFAPLHLGAFPQIDREPDESTWNVLAVARAV